MKTKKIVSLVLAMVMVLSFSSVFVSATDECYLSNAISQTITDVAKPVMDGAVSVDEYGTPIIVTSQAHADANENDQITWTEQSTPEKSDQKAKIYMTYDQTHLYIAATLDHAQPNQRSKGDGGGYHPHLAVTLSQKVGNGVFINEGYEVYLFSRVAYKGPVDDFEPNFYSARYKADGTVGKTNKNEILETITGSSEDYFVAYDDQTQTYTYEMRIQWAKAPGLKNGSNYNGEDFAMTIELADGAVGAKKQPSYYQIGGNAAQQDVFNLIANPHGTKVVTFTPDGQFRVTDSVAPMPDVAPNPNGMVEEGEYGDPIIITSQKHATKVTDDQISWTEKKTLANSDQQAKIYMTNDAQYLYIAATLDNATKDLWTTPGSGGNHPHLAITASKLDGTGVLKDGDAEKYLFARVHVGSASATNELWAVERPSGQNKGVSYDASYVDDTYYFEMRIAWVNIPGMADSHGIYTGDPLAMTIELADGVAENKQLEGSYYTIGGTAARQGNWNTSAPHGDDVMAISCNVPFTEQTVVGPADDLQSALTAAHPGDIIALGDNMTVGNISIPNGIMLNLNGKVLTANSVMAITRASFIKDSSNGDGGIAIAQNNLTFTASGNNKNQLPLYDNGTYRFIDCQTEQLSSATSDCKFGFQFTMTDYAYDLLANPDNAGISLENNMILTKDSEAPISLRYEYKTDNIRIYAENKTNYPERNWAIALTVTGFENVEAEQITLASVPTLVSLTGVEIGADLATYQYSKGE